jgi:hypothetical protein
MTVREFHYKSKKPLSAEEKKKARAVIDKQQEQDSQIVEGIFKNREGDGMVSFSYKKYKDEPVRIYSFENGKTYKIPLGVANHINNGTKIKERDYIVNADGTKDLATFVKNERSRYEFIPTKFS